MNPRIVNCIVHIDRAVLNEEYNVLKIGTLGAARITPAALLAPASQLPGVEVTAVAARNHGRAQTFASKHGITKVFDSYQALLDDPTVDAIYNPLPNGLHKEWSIKAMNAGKHVLCEKPFCNNAEEARQMVAVSQQTGLILMEAFHYRHHPLMARIRGLVPKLGPLRRIETKMCFPLPRFGDIRYDYALGGGSNMDVGAYTSDMVLQIAAASGDPALAGTPRVNEASARLLRPNIDRVMKANLRWESGCSGRIVNSLWSLQIPGIRLRVLGERGQLSVSNPVLPHLWHRLDTKIGGKPQHERVSGKSTYYHQLLEFERRIRNESASPDLQQSIATMELIDAIYTAAGLPLRGALG